MIEFGREVCSDLQAATGREWLVTNGIGGFASGSLAGILTRRYHGLLLAALKPPVGRTLLLAKLNEIVEYDGVTYPIYCDRWFSGEVEPDGYKHLESFRLEGTVPVWTYDCADALLEKRVWMQAGENTTYIQYYYTRPVSHDSGSEPRPLAITLNALCNYRDYHGITQPSNRPELGLEPLGSGFNMTVGGQNDRLFVRSDKAAFTPVETWQSNFFYSVEAARGESSVEDHFLAGKLHAILQPGETLTVVASTLEKPQIDGAAAYALLVEYERGLLEGAGLSPIEDNSGSHGFPAASLRQLVLAAGQFIVSRASTREPEGYSVIAGYPWFADWGRDTMISLPGLTLATGRPQVARRILRTFADSVDQGMLPNRFPDSGEAPEYNTVDATLWFFEAIRAYFEATGDIDLISELFPVLSEIVAWHRRGTRYQIHVDSRDGLLYAGEPGVQLTWMDAKYGDWVVTPRIGKPVEVNALWFNALNILAGFAQRLGKSPAEYLNAAENTRRGFSRFWNSATSYCYDVLDGPQGSDAALRPNQLFAVSLPHSPLSPAHQRRLVDACQRHLLGSLGLRSLAPHEAGYTGHYGGDRNTRDGAYHQGTMWGWLIGPFVLAHLRVYNDRKQALKFLKPFHYHLSDHGLGSISEIFDGDPPFTPNGCPAQAWSVAAILQVLHQIGWSHSEMGEELS